MIPMIAFVSHYFGWGYQEIMKLPVRAFFEFYREGQRMEAREYRECLDIAMVPSMKFGYYEFLREKYNGMIDPRLKELPPKPNNPAIEAASNEAKRAMKSVFGAMRRGMGYG